MSSQQPKPDDGLNERKTEATEKETLKDLEEAFGSSNAKTKNDVPSPDGALDEESELKEADPK